MKLFFLYPEAAKFISRNTQNYFEDVCSTSRGANIDDDNTPLLNFLFWGLHKLILAGVWRSARDFIIFLSFACLQFFLVIIDELVLYCSSSNIILRQR